MKIQKISINDEYIRLDQLLKLAGIAETGGKAKMLILNNQVSVNNKICCLRGKKLYNNDLVTYLDMNIKIEANFDDR